MTLDDWAKRWGVPWQAVVELQRVWGLEGTGAPATVAAGPLESDVQAIVRLEASRAGIHLWRNNVGVLKNEHTGQPVRYGLCNDSPALNKKIKSGDLIGIKPVTVTPEMFGHTIGQFVSREVKAAGWVYRGTDREAAQLKWLQLVNGSGGDAAFVTGEGSFA